MKRARTHLTVFVLGLMCPAIVAAQAPSTQSSPPGANAATQPAATPDRLLDVEFLSLQLAFEGAYDQRSIHYDAQRGTLRSRQYNYRTRRFEETLGMHSAGAVLDPRFLLYDVRIEGGLSQEWFAEAYPGPDRSSTAHGTLAEYDAAFTLFPRGRVSATAFAQQLDTRVPRAFLPSLDRWRERHGVDLVFRDPTLPMRLSLEHTWDELTSRTANLLDDERRGRDRLAYEATWQIGPRHAVRFEYEYDDRTERYAGSRTQYDTWRHYLTLNHTLRFGLDDRSAWETVLRYQDEAGDLARDNAEFSTRLRLQHTAAFSTNYAAQYIRDAFFDVTTETYRGEAGLTHAWADTLTTTLQLYGLEQQADENADFTEWGGLANLAFNKDNAWGRLSANVSYNHASTRTQNGRRQGVVVAESVTLRDPLASFLAQPDVNWPSIVVTDAARTRTYVNGRDYLVFRAGRYTGMTRIPTGQIEDRQTVFVSYTYRVAGDYDLARDRVDFRIQQAFKFGLTPYYAASIQNEELDGERFLRFRARNVNRHRVGATYREARWSTGVEYEYNDDAIDPYQAIHARGDVSLWHDVRNALDGKVSASRYWFDGSDGLAARNATLCDTGLTYRRFLARDFEATASAMYRYEDDTSYGITHGVDLTGALEWRIGLFSLRFEAEYDMLDLPGSRDNSMAFWIKLKRDVPLLAARPG